ncbi:shikimate dehydrogenase (NADP(+)) [Paenibacillus baekrokdamisoli]|uniref:Shikimate dehydrogenase (NADP(+)) n=1 Tax=Paenibacillus baekrokdamisoli TaxID=1712516 RepID=A0A3G9IYV4_9BACL|nr:shikimate dehydrogenase [Paenibacillus baekrokdamisoli]MBB3070339.1 shikimate dehydrogenase [Paenibacillus baekrokdamisoli]BBH21345.1 shikimate dehydrogenase (NADP(+)) [Paenibacillus baekrokdamisoli]
MGAKEQLQTSSTQSFGNSGNSVDSHTVLFSVIGDPIRHSKSPVMMNRAFREKGINGIYTAFHVTAATLSDFVAGVRAMGIRGVNVTIPHKLAIMPLLDEIDESAQAIGAVNTIVNNDGHLVGYNTDGLGYVRSLKEEVEPHLAGANVLIVGAGGATRGILYALAREGVSSVVIANRTVERAQELADAFRGQVADITAIGNEALQEACAKADIVINTTSLGMYPNVDTTPLQAAWLKPNTIASDLIYNPMTTRFLEEAKLQGCRIHGGLGMFIYQGAYAFEYWTGVDAPVEAMRETVLEALGHGR